MALALYDTLVPFYHLLDPVAEHADEMAVVIEAFEGISPCNTLLELGAGAGNNAFHLKAHVACTLTDLSPAMLGLSRAQNPECEHLVADMRTLRQGRTYDVVLAHDGITYMSTLDDLRAAVLTAFVHTRPGGLAVFAPDVYRETFEESTDLYEGDDGTRALRCLEWSWDPSPDDHACITEYSFLLREGGEVVSVHDRHVEGLFSRAEWREVLTEVGFTVGTTRRPIGDGETDEIFVCRRP